MVILWTPVVAITDFGPQIAAPAEVWFDSSPTRVVDFGVPFARLLVLPAIAVWCDGFVKTGDGKW